MMGKIYCNKCRKYSEFKKHKKSNICDRALLFSSICNKCGKEDQKIFKEEESIEILKFFVYINNM